jgi:hypothetical protein
MVKWTEVPLSRYGDQPDDDFSKRRNDMTPKDYELLAMSITRSRLAVGLRSNAKQRKAALDAIQLVAIDLAASLVNANPRFDRERFLKACGY